MAKNRYINTKFWDDSYISDLGPNAKLLYLYFLTNALTNICGAYEISIKRIVFDTGIAEELIKGLLKRFAEDKKVLYVDGYIIIKNFIKHQKQNPSIIAGIKAESGRLPANVMTACNKLSQAGTYLNMNLNSNSNSNSNIKELGNSVKDKKDKTTSRKIINKIKKDLKIKGVIK